MTKKRGRPATGETPRRTVRVPDEVWKAAEKRAKERGENVSDAVRRCLEEYGKDD